MTLSWEDDDYADVELTPEELALVAEAKRAIAADTHPTYTRMPEYVEGATMAIMFKKAPERTHK
jgi:hypothetical protein